MTMTPLVYLMTMPSYAQEPKETTEAAHWSEDEIRLARDLKAGTVFLSPGSVYRNNLISYLMRKNEEIRGKRLGLLKR